MSAALLPHPDVCRLRQRCAGRCPSPSWDLHLQSRVERGNAYMLHLTLLEVSKTFPKVLNFLFSTTQQPTEPWRVALIKCSTSFSEVIFNHQLSACYHTNQGKRLVCRGSRGRALCALCTRHGWQHQRMANLAPRLGPSTSAPVMRPDKEDSVFNKTYFGYRQCCSFPGESYQFHVKLLFACTEEKLQSCSDWELPVKWEKISVQPQTPLLQNWFLKT